MLHSLSKSILLLSMMVVITCVIYPFLLWLAGAYVFPYQAAGSILYEDGKPVGSRLIAQAFTQDIYFQPRPSAAGFDAAASASSALAASNDALRERVARAIGPIARYQSGALVGHDIEKWLQQDTYQGKPHLVEQWALLHPRQAVSWIAGDQQHYEYLEQWKKTHVTEYTATENLQQLAVQFFVTFSRENPGKFPVLVNAEIKPVNSGKEIQAVFFDMWRNDHPDVVLQSIPADMVMSSASGLDPDITLQNALAQLDRVANARAVNMKKPPAVVKSDIEALVMAHATAPFYGLIGDKIVNVLALNLALRKQYGV